MEQKFSSYTLEVDVWKHPNTAICFDGSELCVKPAVTIVRNPGHFFFFYILIKGLNLKTTKKHKHFSIFL